VQGNHWKVCEQRRTQAHHHMKPVFFFLFAVFVCSVSSQTFQWFPCTPSTYIVHNATMSPDPVIPGKNVTFTTYGNQTKILTSGYWNATVYLGPIKVQTFQGNLCAGGKSTILQGCPNGNSCPCPIQNGREAILTLPVRSDAPAGATLNSTLLGFDLNGTQFFCFKSSFGVAK